MDSEKYLLLKLSPKKHIIGLTSQQILELASQPYRIDAKKVGNINIAYLTFQKQIIGKFKIIDSITKKSNNYKTNFILEPLNTNLIGTILNSKTTNPATTITSEKFNSILLK